MPRPCKRRRICALPGCRRFGVLDGSLKEQPPVIMTLDEFETVRLNPIWQGLTTAAIR